MSTDATLTITATPEHGPTARTLTLDCDHGQTVGILIPAEEPGAFVPHESATVRLLLLKHFSEEQCACTATLRRRYGLAAVSVSRI